MGDPIRSVAFSDIKHGGAPCSINFDSVLMKDVESKGYRIVDACKYTRSSKHQDSLQTVRTILGRYSKHTKTLSGIELDMQVKNLYSGFKKFVDVDNVSFTEDDFSRSLDEYLFALKERKIDYDSRFNSEFISGFNGAFGIQGFLKQQEKFDPDEGRKFKDKFGQGVSAWNKTLNAYVSVYIRALHIAIQRNMRDGCVITNGESDDFYSNHYSICTNHYHGKILDYCANDFTEFDSCQNNVSLEFECYLLRKTGIPEFCVQLFKEQRSKWSITSPGNVQLNGMWKKHSGAPDTLSFNCYFNMSVMGYVCEWDELVFAAFKGDDSLLVGINIKQSQHFSEYCAMNDYKMKFVIPPVAEFIGFVITDKFFFPDIVRRIAKFHSMTFRDIDHFNEARLSLGDIFRYVDSYQTLIEGAYYICSYYGVPVNTGAVEGLLRYSQQLANLKHAVPLEYFSSFSVFLD